MNNYFNNEDLPKLHPSYCVFLDILGFSAKIKGDIDGSYLKNFYHVFKDSVGELLNDSQGDALFHFRQFTDNIFIAKPDTDQESDTNFGFTLMDICKYQFNMAIKGYFVRGGFTIGDLFIDDHLIYGNGLLEAYDLESKSAIYPIVILSDNLKNRVNEFKRHYHNDDTSPIKMSVLSLSDGTLFINYLSELVEREWMGDDIENLGRDLAAHKEQVVKNLKEHQKNPYIFEKYLFIAHYHNYCLGTLNYKRYSSQDLTIKIEDYPLNYEFNMI